ncbi:MULTISPECIES: DeoR family transcriptional regulator [Candidatus Nitrosocaldus]|jgi:Mn-dependent DtxR family transcriptional regulator|uniref:TFIIEalpha/SarR/Rpc3 HTH domain-containing protein n=1 Tax=Candidatus Nitrosocaldus cavascurensis TaxID=2058097 RepID=A0A2K5AS15_9ARCH|nr:MULTISPECIES: DeoR family transcriptional regulator [Candidatus Nitrosocaldus]SPC34441.1 protein of unknown function [Candidatus Nitrosocaldus cavascurensis]
MGDVVKGILEVLLQKGEVRLVELTTLLKVSEESLRDAINTLENLGLVNVERSNDLLVRFTDDARKLLSR